MPKTGNSCSFQRTKPCIGESQVNDVAKVKERTDFNEFEEEIKEAAESCPNEAIQFEEE